jgi:ferredoxin
MRAFVDEEVCTGCGLCTETCPEVFELSDETATVIVDEVPEEAVDTCKQAADECPVEAISLEED